MELGREDAGGYRITLGENPDSLWQHLFMSEERPWRPDEVQMQDGELRLSPVRSSSLAELRWQVQAAVADTNLRWQKEVPCRYENQIGRLEKWAICVIGVLAVISVASAVLSIQFLPRGFGQNGDAQQLAWLAISGGILGSALAALKSALDRYAAGWEFNDGVKFPRSALKERFLLRMVPWLLVRPVLGGVMGLVIFTGLVGGFLIAADKRPSAYSGHGILFLAILGGLFAKTLWDRLLDVFKMLVGEGGRREDSGQSGSGTSQKGG